jgi:hypothetical protein
MSTSSGAVAVGAGSGTGGSDPEYLKVLLTRGDIVTKRGEKGHQGYEVSFVIVAWVYAGLSGSRGGFEVKLAGAEGFPD